MCVRRVRISQKDSVVLRCGICNGHETVECERETDWLRHRRRVRGPDRAQEPTRGRSSGATAGRRLPRRRAGPRASSRRGAGRCRRSRCSLPERSMSWRATSRTRTGVPMSSTSTSAPRPIAAACIVSLTASRTAMKYRVTSGWVIVTGPPLRDLQFEGLDAPSRDCR